MKFETPRYVKIQRAKLRHGVVALQDRVGPLADAVGVLIIGAVVVAVLIRLKIGAASDLGGVFAGFVGAALAVYFVKVAARQHHILIEVTMSYLVHGGKPFLDSLLGKLIGGVWHKDQLRPGDALFDVLETVVRGHDYELKRRVAEAVPSLGEIDPKRAVAIVAILREDWDPTWHSDLRRRAVEALANPAVRGSAPLLFRANQPLVKNLLQLREQDQVYVGFAIAEALHEWEDAQPKIVPQLWGDLLAFSSKIHSANETHAIGELIGLLNVVKNGDALDLADKIAKMSQDGENLVRIGAARNVYRLGSRLPEQTLDLMLTFLNPGQIDNVRRPIAREQSVQFLVDALDNRSLEPKARQVLMTLMADPDEIIRTTAFDKVEALRGKHADVLSQVCQYVITHEASQTLRQRAEQAVRG